ncbi:MAG: tetratricopeptide repeat protein [bacterium]
MTNSDKRKVFFLLITALAITVRAIYLHDIIDTVEFKVPLLDAAWYDTHALEVLKGDLLASQSTFRVPLYIYFLAGCYKIFGHQYLPPVLFQVILGSLVCGIIFLIGDRVFGFWAGLVAGLGMALHRVAVFSDLQLLPTTIFIFGIVVATYLVIRGLETDKARSWILAGVCIGISFLTRPDVVFFTIAICLIPLFKFGARRGFRRISSVLSPVVVAMLLLGVRNLIVTGEFHLFSSQGSLNLYIGNAAFADGKTPVHPPTHAKFNLTMDRRDDSMLAAAKQHAMEDLGRPITDSELSRYLLRRTIEDIRQNPARWVILMLKKVYYFLNNYERSDLKPMWRISRNLSWTMKNLLLPFTSAIVPASLGFLLVLVRKDGRGLVILAGFVAFALGTILFFVSWRYRLPAVIYIWILAGYGLVEVLRALNARRFIFVISSGLLMGAVGFVSASSYLGVRDEAFSANYLVNEAVVHSTYGLDDEAVSILKEAIDLNPASERTHFVLGHQYAKMGKIDEARREMGIATMLFPGYLPAAHTTLGVALFKAGDYAKAADEFREALKFASTDVSIKTKLVVSLMHLGEIEEAERMIAEIEDASLVDPNSMLTIAKGWVNIGEPERAETILRNLIQEDPTNVDARIVMATALETQGRYEEAVLLLREASRLDPFRQDIQDLLTSLESKSKLLR